MLPETIATVDGVRISAAEIRKAWEKVTAELPDSVQPETLERIYKGLTEKCLWKREIILMLAEAEIKADKNTAEKYLALRQKQYPALPALSRKKADLLLNSPQFQLKSAIFFYLHSIAPSKIKVTQPEVAALYRSMPEKFRIPGKENWGIIEVASHSTADTVRALLLQGSSFQTVAQRFSPGGMQSPLPAQLLAMGPKMKINDITPVIKSEKGWITAKLLSREKSAILPLEKVYLQLATALADRKEAAALTEILQKRLLQKKIIYHPLVRRNPAK